MKAFTYIEVLISLFLLLSALLFTGRANMTSLQLVRKSKINQQATLRLLDQLQELRMQPIEELLAGEFEKEEGAYLIQWKIADHTPYFGTKQIQCQVTYKPETRVIVESLFYRSE